MFRTANSSLWTPAAVLPTWSWFSCRIHQLKKGPLWQIKKVNQLNHHNYIRFSTTSSTGCVRTAIQKNENIGVHLTATLIRRPYLWRSRALLESFLVLVAWIFCHLLWPLQVAAVTCTSLKGATGPNDVLGQQLFDNRTLVAQPIYLDIDIVDYHWNDRLYIHHLQLNVLYTENFVEILAIQWKRSNSSLIIT